MIMSEGQDEEVELLHPVLFHLGSLEIYSFGLMLSLAFASAAAVAFFNAKRHGIDPWLVVDMCLYLYLAGLVGSRLVFVLLNWHEYAAAPITILYTWEGGVSFYGAIMGGFVAVLFLTRRRRLSFGRVADTFAPALALAAAIGRLGCALNGCCYGVPTDGAWGVFSRFAPGLRHPTQLYESFAYFTAFVFLLWWQKRRAKAPGQVFVAFVLAYIVGRFVVEFFRDGERLYAWLSLTQAASLVIAVVAIGAYRYLGRRAEAAPALAPGPSGQTAAPNETAAGKTDA